MFDLDVRSRQPIYEQLVDKVKQLIIKQVLKPDEKLPSVRMLSKELTVNPNTIQKAYRELEREGYIYSVKGKGNFVVPLENMPKTEKRTEIENQIRKLLPEAIYHGLTKDEWIDMYNEVKRSVEEGNKND